MSKLNFQNKPILAMAQPVALPGSCRYQGENIKQISELLLEEVGTLIAGGVDGVILQNFHDGPIKDSSSPEAIGYLTRLACDIKRTYPDALLGVLVCWDGPASLVVADAAQADFIRVEHVYCGAELTAAGIIEGQCVEVQRIKRKIGSSVPVFADVFEPHSTPLVPRSVEDAAADCVFGGFADGLFLCGRKLSESIEYATRIRQRVPSVPIICGGGSTAENIGQLLNVFDGVCVGAWIKNGSLSNPVDPNRLNQYMEAVYKARASIKRDGDK